ncbi:glycosyltransferase family 2 protein [Nonomuraea mesophila]|uniref:Glycosyltransferase family 2 protein n=1 Tax=Nonomuraea mesophila TaxID=2530382 RepID=A0A4V2Z9T3_9ACTN|nr:glycosyltransferase family 2 protein [Nonomuraea mesophila]TDE46255.1 glycosyltransferase family 2 protein [Nonomuraea mesophila]
MAAQRERAVLAMSATENDDDEVDVSVVIPVHNCRAYLDLCLTAALIQRVKKELIVVDDGSTDGSGELLDLYASHHPSTVKVIHVDASGGAGRPRNVGLEHATGRYVFFCDADDHLGPEALERMVAMADRNDSDIVLGKVVGHGRRAPVSMFQQSADRVELGEGNVYNSLCCFKLFRRDLLERHLIRFGEGMRVGEDILFTVHAYCHAGVISVVADYDCYHLMARPDGTSIMQQAGSRDPLAWLAMIREPIRLMAAHIEPGPLRDHLLRRHFRLDVFTQLGAAFLDSDDVRRKDIAREVAALCDEWYTPGVHERLNSIDRQRATALDDIDRLVRLARIESATVRRRLTGVCWDGDQLVVTGSAGLHGIARDHGLAVVLRARHDPAAEMVIPAERKGGEFSVRVDVSALASGIWDLRVAVEIEGALRFGRLGADREDGVGRPTPRMIGGVVVLPYFTRDNGNLSIDVGGHVVAVPGGARVIRTRWGLGQRLLIDGEISVVDTAPAAVALRRIVWRERRDGRERAEPVTALPGGGFAAALAVGRLPPGTWDAYLELDLGGPAARFRIQADAGTVVGPRRWWWAALRRSVRPYTTRGRLSTVVRRLTARTVINRIIR